MVFLGKSGSMIPFGSFRIGRLFGIDIEINYTWFIIFILVTLALAFSYFPTIYPTIPVGVNLIIGVFTSILFFASVLFHEMAHSLVALRNNLKISKITLFIFGGVSQMTGEPQSPGVEFRMAISGPLSSFVLSFVFAAIFVGFRSAELPVAFQAPFGWLAIINAVLGIFNLFPGFPLDGGRVFRSILWFLFKDVSRATKIAARVGQLFAYSLMLLGLFMIFRGLIDGLWLILVGWFLNNAAQGSYQQLILRQTLGDVKVKDLMKTQIDSISARSSLTEAVQNYFLKFRHSKFPVVDQQKLEGSVALNDIKKIPRNEWNEKQIKEVIAPIPEDKKITPEGQAMDALMQMSQDNSPNLMVVENDQLIGLINRHDILSLLKIKGDLNNKKAA